LLIIAVMSSRGLEAGEKKRYWLTRKKGVTKAKALVIARCKKEGKLD